MSNLNDNVRKSLQFNSCLNVIITVGNSLRCDDGVGPFIASQLESKDNLKIINAGDRPENIIDEVIGLKPSAILIIDAADFGGFPGEVRLIDEDHIPETSISTHSISLKVIADILKADTKAMVKFLGIQPKNVEMGESICDEVRASAEAVIREIKNA